MNGLIKPSLLIANQIKTINNDKNDDENTPKKNKEENTNSSIQVEDIENVSELFNKSLSFSDDYKSTTADSQVTSTTKHQDKSTQIKNKKNQEYINKILASIKFTSMSAIEFCSGPGLSNLMSDSQKYDILSRICLTNNVLPRPKNLPNRFKCFSQNVL